MFVTPCPICSADGHIAGDEEVNNKKNGVLFECKYCHHRWKVRENDEAVAIANSILQRNESTPVSWVLNQLPADLLSRKNIKVLDIGCWTGEILLGLPDSWDCYGVELNEQAVQEATRKGLHVLHGTLEEVEFEEDFFDVVIMLDVMEHLTDPITTLFGIGTILKHSGLFVALTGRADCFASKLYKNNWYYCNYPEHINFFSKNSIKFALDKSNMDVEKIESVIHPVASNKKTLVKLINRLLGRQNNCDDGLPLSLSTRSNMASILSRIFRGKDHYIILGRRR